MEREDLPGPGDEVGPIDPRALRAAIHRLVSDRLRLFAGFSVAWAAAHSLVLWALAAAPPPPWMWACTLGVAALAALAIRARRHLRTVHALNAAGLALGLAEVAVIALSARTTGEPAFAYATPMIMVGAGMLVLHRAWLLGFLAGAAALALALGHLPGQARTTELIVLGSAATTSLLLHEAARSHTLALEALRQRDAVHRGALEGALAELRTQLAERQRAEDEGQRLREQLIQAQKMEAIGTLAGGFAHDMNNVLGGILGIAEMLREDVPPQHREDLDGIIDSTRRGAELTRNLLGFARRGKYRKEPVTLGAIIDELLRLLTRTVPKGIVFKKEVAEPSPVVEGDPALLTQALINLCINSVDAMRGVGTLTISAGLEQVDTDRALALGVEARRYAVLAVTDTGCGMDAATQRRVFEPFFTTKAVGRGTGLGLAMVYGTVQGYQGGIELRSEVGVGTRIALFLPAAEVAVESPKRPSQPLPQGTRAQTILCVDDDDTVRRLARRILTASGYAVLEARDGQEALEVHAATPGLALVVLDMSMPVMGGAACFHALRARDPRARVLLVSGYTLEDDAQRCLDAGAVGFVDKPFTVESLSVAVARALGPDGAAPRSARPPPVAVAP